MASPTGTGSLTASNRILLAMVDSHQGRVDDARAALAEARRDVERWESEPFQLGTSVKLWFDWGNARILLKEAEGLPARAQE